jgi:hypothetical protein
MLAQPQLWYEGRRKVPDIGPSGGFVFYDKGNNSNGWRFLEAAPAFTEFTAPWIPVMEALDGNVDGWRLPTREELALMYRNLKQKGLGGFADEPRYWSLAEGGGVFLSFTNAYNQSFRDGAQFFANKGNLYKVRAVREF